MHCIVVVEKLHYYIILAHRFGYIIFKVFFYIHFYHFLIEMKDAKGRSNAIFVVF